jgi:hypothetical protein
MTTSPRWHRIWSVRRDDLPPPNGLDPMARLRPTGPLVRERFDFDIEAIYGELDGARMAAAPVQETAFVFFRDPYTGAGRAVKVDEFADRRSPAAPARRRCATGRLARPRCPSGAPATKPLQAQVPRLRRSRSRPRTAGPGAAGINPRRPQARGRPRPRVLGPVPPRMRRMAEKARETARHGEAGPPPAGRPDDLFVLVHRTIDAHLVMYHEPQSAIAEQYRTFRTNLVAMNSGGAPRALAVTSTIKGEGKSVTTANLALALVELPDTRAIVDADLRARCSTRCLASARAGLTD